MHIEDNLRDLILSFYHVDPGNLIKVVRLEGKATFTH